MKTAIMLALGLAIGVPSAFAQESKTTATPVAKTDLSGNFEIVSGEDNGKDVSEDKIKGSTVRVTSDTIVVVDKEDKEVYVTKYTLDSKTSPYKITMTETGGPRGRKGEKAVGIIEKDGDTLKLAYAYEGGIVPTQFKTEAGAKQLYFKMKRKAAK
jgi:uncharacterized protein (TIGR03067 family)